MSGSRFYPLDILLKFEVVFTSAFVLLCQQHCLVYLTSKIFVCNHIYIFCSDILDI